MKYGENLIYLENKYKPLFEVCTFCYPDNTIEMMEKSGLFVFVKENFTWKDGYTPEKYAQYIEFTMEFKKERRTKVITLNTDFNTYCCKKHLLGMVESIDEFEREQNGKTS